ncbi:MAG: hypothetical protein AAFU77_11705 [Myxococcota bacterium]
MSEDRIEQVLIQVAGARSAGPLSPYETVQPIAARLLGHGEGLRLFRQRYQAIRAETEHVDPTIVRQPGVMALANRLLARGALPRPQKALRIRAESSSPDYMAFALIAWGRFEFDRLDDPSYLWSIERSFYVERSHLEAGLWLVALYDEVELFRRMELSMTSWAQQAHTLSPDQFATHVLLPFLEFLSRGYAQDASTKNLIIAAFGQVFGVSALPFADFVNRFIAQQKGLPLSGRWLRALNRTLAPHRLRVYASADAVRISQMLDYSFAVNQFHVERALLLRRLGVTRLPDHAGLSVVADPNVVIEYDVHDVMARQIVDELAGRPADSPVDGFVKLVQAFGGPSSDPRAIYNHLVGASFDGHTLKEIRSELIGSTAIHELKHKWEEPLAIQLEWWTIELEFSAWVSSIVYGDCPHYELIGLLFQLGNSLLVLPLTDEYRPKLLALFRRALEIADASTRDVLDEQGLRAASADMYRNYKPDSGGRLASLDEFEAMVVDPVVRQMPPPP